ncbi:MAG: peptidyl-prolyl cis-trans isomerase family protein [Caulobacteraceae bacterium]|nr:peptidyl-prolyl cis-trans isomerase family protein [Caulobacteraceae bacterium]
MIRTRLSAWVVATAVGAVAAAAWTVNTPALAQTPLREGAAAVVNDEIISTYDLKQRMAMIVGRASIKLTKDNEAEVQQEALYSLIDERLKLQELHHQEIERKAHGKIIIPDTEVDQEVLSIAKNNKMTPQQYYSILASWGVDPEAERTRIRAEKSWVYWISGFYGRRVRISQQEVDAYLADVTARASKPSFLVGEIFIDSNRAGSVEKAVQMAEQLTTQLQQNASFQQVATQFSGLPTAAAGGDAGWLLASEMRPEVAAVVEQLRPGQLSRPIPVSDGAYLVYLRDKRTGGGTPVVNLKQVALRVAPEATPAELEAARQKLLGVKTKITGCANLEQAAQGLPEAAAGDLGEAEVKDLSPAFREVAEKLAINQVSDPIRTDVGMHLVAVCGRRDSAVQLPSREEVMNELENQKLSMIAKREILNLRTSATIETR